MNEVAYHNSAESAAAGEALFAHIAEYFCCANSQTEQGFSRRLYKDTACGAWFKFTERGFAIGTIVEGSDAALEYHYDYSPNLDLDTDEERALVHAWLDHHIDQLEQFADEMFAC